MEHRTGIGCDGSWQPDGLGAPPVKDPIDTGGIRRKNKQSGDLSDYFIICDQTKNISAIKFFDKIKTRSGIN
jgi:hypothetical protein